MPLNDLDVTALGDLANSLTELHNEVVQLSAYGFEPRIDLTPGRIVTIHLRDFVMPEAAMPPVDTIQAENVMNEGESVDESIARIDETGAILWRRTDELRRHLLTLAPWVAVITGKEIPDFRLSDDLPAPISEAATGRRQTGEAAAPPADEEPAGGNPISADPSRSGDEAVPLPAAVEAIPPLAEAASPEGEAEIGGGQAVAALPAALVEAESIPTQVAHRNTFGKLIWTNDEDLRLIDLICKGVRDLGLSKSGAIRSAAQELGRPEQGTAFRCHTKLKDRINAALTEAPPQQVAIVPEASSLEFAAPALGNDTGPAPPSATDVQDEPADQKAEGTPVPAPAKATPDLHGFDLHLWTYLQDHRPRWPLTIGIDLDLIEALGRGEKLPMIAANLGVDAARLKSRFQVLTAPILDAKDRPTIDGMRRLVACLRRIVNDAAKAA